MGKSANLLFTECSTPEFVDMCTRALEEKEKDNQDAIMATLIVHVNERAHEGANDDGRYNDISYSDVSNVAKSLYVGIKHGYSVPPSSKG